MRENLFLGKLHGFVWVIFGISLAQHRKRGTDFLIPSSWEGNCAPELQEQHPARPQSSCRSWGGEFGISWEGGFRFQEILLSQSGLRGIWKDHLPKIPSEGNWIPFPHQKKTKPSYGRVKFSVSQWLQDITKSWGFSCWRLFLFFFKELEASVKSTGCS